MQIEESFRDLKSGLNLTHEHLNTSPFYCC
ncbi:MAG: hypothetical protein P1P93_06560 [Gammaproteobacteria bacterium]|nr:hypothetical protein [Gammaproteobacteria bacterium]